MAVKRLTPKFLEKVMIPTEVETFTPVYYYNALKYRIWAGPTQPPAQYTLNGDIWRNTGTNPDTWFMYLETSGTWVSLLASTSEAGLMSRDDKVLLNSLGSVATDLSTHIAVGVSNNSLAHGATTAATPYKIVARDSAGGAYAVTFHTTSTREAKDNIYPTSKNALSIINDTVIVDFTYKEDARTTPHIGFIAEDTNPILTGPDQDKMDIGNAIGLLMKAVQELSAEVDALRAQIEA